MHWCQNAHQALLFCLPTPGSSPACRAMRPKPLLHCYPGQGSHDRRGQTKLNKSMQIPQTTNNTEHHQQPWVIQLHMCNSGTMGLAKTCGADCERVLYLESRYGHVRIDGLSRPTVAQQSTTDSYARLSAVVVEASMSQLAVARVAPNVEPVVHGDPERNKCPCRNRKS